MGFEVNNDPFKKNSKFFRDALVLANAATTSRYRTDQYLKWFTDNLLFDGAHELVIVPFKSQKDFYSHLEESKQKQAKFSSGDASEFQSPKI